MKKQQRNNFTKNLKNLLNEEIPCSIQHDGWPCNTCFHDWAQTKLKLSPYFAHNFWEIVLALRGDYTQKELIKSIKQEILNDLKQTNEKSNNKTKKTTKKLVQK